MRTVYKFRIENRLYYVKQTGLRSMGLTTRWVPVRDPKLQMFVDRTREKVLDVFCAKTGMSRDEAFKFLKNHYLQK